MNWIPNEEGIKWFLDSVWSKVVNNIGDTKLYLAGREMPQWLTELKLKNIIVVGEVPDAHGFINSKCISIAPLFSGSGIRIKIIESMALGKAVISTSIGAEGINYTNGKNIMIADDASSFAEAIIALTVDKDKCISIGQSAKKLIHKEHDKGKLADRLIKFYGELK